MIVLSGPIMTPVLAGWEAMAGGSTDYTDRDRDFFFMGALLAFSHVHGLDAPVFENLPADADVISAMEQELLNFFLDLPKGD